ncbi:hypothetical protein H8B09_26825 [Paenibacillus sp. PR3]|uniref:Uncharacterized protein n=1 Tax=Paenibacillus terricola TaxID=2763503 RepID=A0ABR8N4D5_9BACL|nr:hypothetical protein [Paenibacillus terricola]MBD3922396.1 hypothetical protein [Paenibacillus terricola]
MTAKEMESFPLLSANEVILHTLTLPPGSTQADINFWKEDHDNRDPFYENTILLHYPTIRNRIGYDLSNRPGNAFVADDVVAALQQEELFHYNAAFYHEYHDHYFHAISVLWAWRLSSEKPNKIKLNKCHAFAYALYESSSVGLIDGEYPDFISKTHKDAWTALLKLLDKEGPASPYRSLQIMYALLKFCNLTRKSKDLSLN